MAPNVVLIKGDPIPKEYPLNNANAPIQPGMLIEVVAGKVRPHSTAGGNASPLFANLAFSSPERDINSLYNNTDENVHTLYFRPGDEVNALLEQGANVADGALLQSNGAGALEAYTPPADVEDASGPDVFVRAPVVRAREAVNNSGGSGPVRIKVEVL